MVSGILYNIVCYWRRVYTDCMVRLYRTQASEDQHVLEISEKQNKGKKEGVMGSNGKLKIITH